MATLLVGSITNAVVATTASPALDRMKSITQFCATTKSFQIDHNHLLYVYE